MEDINEGRQQIKRKYGEYGAIRVNETAPIRNEILRFIDRRFVTEEEMKNFLTKLSEDRGKDLDARQWFSRNGRYFEKFENRGQEVWTLSKYGKRILEFLRKETDSNKLNESIGLFKSKEQMNESTIESLENTLFLDEATRKPAAQVNREAEIRLKAQLANYSKMMKANPKKANVYKAKIDLANAKLITLTAKKKLDQITGRK
jgi:hypothetical protein